VSQELPVTLRHLEGTDNRRLDLVVVIPVARCEWHLAMKLLKWIDCLRDSPEIIVYCAPPLSKEERDALHSVTPCTVVHATHFKDVGYFGSANQMIKGALDWMESKRPGKAMLYVEADCVPMRSGWFDEILDEYRGCGQPFMGDVHLCAINHMTGNAVYHPEWRKVAPPLANLPGPDPEWGWDSQYAAETITRAHRAKTIQQIWRPPLPITAEWAAKNIRPETALFHQQKDGSLIDVLCQQRGLPFIPLPKQLEESTYAKGRQTPEDPALVAQMTPQQKIIAGMRTSGQVPTMGILIVTCARHMDYLRYCLKSIEKFATGFSEVVVAVEESEAAQFSWIRKQRVHVYKPAHPDKGMLSHQVVKCRADEIMPSSDAILFVDSDCMFWKPTTPESFVVNGKLRLVRERYADVKNPLRKNWQKAVENSMGFKPEYDGMVCHGIVHWREVFPALRKAVEAHTGMKFDEHFTAGRNEFQQEVSEFGSMIAIAIRDLRHRYHPIDYSVDADCKELGIPYTGQQYVYRKSRDNLVEFWGHAPLSRYKSDMDAILRGRTPDYYLK
jgi:hypothetical protein